MDKNLLAQYIKDQAKELGFLECTISKAQISQESQSKFNNWIANNYNGSMDYLANNREIRFNPALIHDGTISIICVKLPYLTQPMKYHKERLADENHGYISSYALGRDYHKVNKKLLNELAKKINQYLDKNNQEHQYRVFTDSAPIMEIELAKNSGLGWRGKNTLLLDKNHGSMFFLGEIFTNLDLPADEPITEHCGSCKKCIDVCPTKAFVSPYVLDARRCISYLTIENKDSIPVELRKLIGNRIYGCDDCQLFCPWNKFSKLSSQIDFTARNNLDSGTLLELFSYSEETFNQRMQGSPIYRIGYYSWLRNIAVGIGNSPYSKDNINALEGKLFQINNEIAKEHILWAIKEQKDKFINQS
jgi:epoxyqueuosine reductase